MTDSISQFCEAIRVCGLEPPQLIEPGKLHRFPGLNKQPRNRAGWCFMFPDQCGGCFGDWSSGVSESWQASRGKRYTDTRSTKFLQNLKRGKAEALTQRQAIWAEAVCRAEALWKEAVLAPSVHPYLVRKGISVHGARLHKHMLVLPVLDFHGRLSSLQFIDANGKKNLLSGGRKRGCYIPVTEVTADSSNIIVCEGWATGCTLAENKPASTVLAAIDAGNLKPVAVAARGRWPSSELVIAGDDDRLTDGNPGATKARKAALAADALLALPCWPTNAPKTLTDFNDLAQWLTGGNT